jgi:hypothetical protein
MHEHLRRPVSGSELASTREEQVGVADEGRLGVRLVVLGYALVDRSASGMASTAGMPRRRGPGSFGDRSRSGQSANAKTQICARFAGELRPRFAEFDVIKRGRRANDH